jgi:hypothetical protein
VSACLDISVSSTRRVISIPPGRSTRCRAVPDYRPLPELADVVGLTEAGLAPDLLAESLQGAVFELADGSPGR